MKPCILVNTLPFKTWITVYQSTQQNILQPQETTDWWI
jgi:hypothetical protein